MNGAHYLRLTLVFLFVLVSSFSANSQNETEALLQLKRSFTQSRVLDSWRSDSSPPCKEKSWIGIVCSNGSVTGLRLRSMELSGRIDVDALVQFPSLRTISFANNSFEGTIPEFNRLGALKALYLSNNLFFGEIPANYFDNMFSLKKVWLDSNAFTGKIPISLSKSSYLTELHLEKNAFSGVIPPIDQSTLNSFDVSYNALEGDIPKSLNKFGPDVFKGNKNLCGEVVERACHHSNSVLEDLQQPEKKGNHRFAVVGMMLSLLLCLLAVIAVLMIALQESRPDMFERGYFGADTQVPSGFKRKTNSYSKSRGPNKGDNADLVMVNDSMGQFGLSDLMKAAAEVLGSGSLGSAYKAVMANGVTVVVKRMKEMSRVGKDGFEAEMLQLGKLKHPNLLSPLAFHYRKDEKLLVYEYVSHGSLLYLLHGDRGAGHAALDWPTRLRIVRGIARGLSFLHSELRYSDIPHGNLKSCNILLRPDLEPLLVDFGFSPLVHPTQASQCLFAYKSPEFINYHHVSPKSDVYCFGIVILEIITGKFPSQYLNNGKGGTDLLQWVSLAMSESREAQLFDPQIVSPKKSLSDLERLLHVAIACVEPNPEARLSAIEALVRIEEIADRNEKVGEEQLPSRSFRADLENMREGELSSRRRDSFREHSLRRNSDNNYAFDIS